jgi:ABC-type multidrug transport system permease subunit
MSDRPSTRLDGFRALCSTRFLEFFRESEVVFWSFIFPIILSVGLGIAFRNRPVESSQVVVTDGPRAEELMGVLRSAPLLKATVSSEADGARALRMGKADLVVSASAGPPEYQFDPSRPESVVARSRVDDALQAAAGRKDLLSAKDRPITESGGRYIDFLIPGIIGMNIMSGGMWGVGFYLVDMRIKRLLKRLLATPMRRTDFMLATMSVRIASMFVEMTFVLLFARFVFGVVVRGNYFSIFGLGALGALAFGGMGLLVAARPKRIEGVMGLMNVVTMPMFVCSGIFFSWERFPAVVQPVIRLLPLTALNDALRGLILEGTPLAAQWPRLAVLFLWGATSFILGLKLFRWT